MTGAGERHGTLSIVCKDIILLTRKEANHEASPVGDHAVRTRRRPSRLLHRRPGARGGPPPSAARATPPARRHRTRDPRRVPPDALPSLAARAVHGSGPVAAGAAARCTRRDLARIRAGDLWLVGRQPRQRTCDLADRASHSPGRTQTLGASLRRSRAERRETGRRRTGHDGRTRHSRCARESSRTRAHPPGHQRRPAYGPAHPRRGRAARPRVARDETAPSESPRQIDSRYRRVTPTRKPPTRPPASAVDL